jgi:hypothetical protein
MPGSVPVGGAAKPRPKPQVGKPGTAGSVKGGRNG